MPLIHYVKLFYGTLNCDLSFSVYTTEIAVAVCEDLAFLHLQKRYHLAAPLAFNTRHHRFMRSF